VPDDPRKSKAGRPRSETPGVRVTTWMREPDYDRLLRLAKSRDDNSISGAMRDLLKLRLK
jgi:hypothetical protein